MQTKFLIPSHNDLKLISEAEKSFFGKEFGINLIKNHLKNSGYAIIAITNGKFSGHMISNISRLEADIITLLIIPDFQRKGIGRRLMIYFAKYLISKGIKYILLEVSVNNFQALEFYSSLGFNRVGLRPLYYKNDNVRSDAKVLKGNTEYIQNFKVK